MTGSSVPSDDEFDAVMLYIADRHDLRHGSFGVFMVLPAVPTVSNDDLRNLVSSAVSQGFLKAVGGGGFQITLEGLRRGEARATATGGTSLGVRMSS